MANLKDLSKWCSGLPDLINQSANDYTKQFASEIAVELIRDTPVDESTALSNWQIGIGSAPTTTLPAFYAGKRGSTALPSITSAIKSVFAKLKSRTLDQPIHITNNTPYILDLNAGSSKQAPQNFIEAAQRRVVNRMKSR